MAVVSDGCVLCNVFSAFSNYRVIISVLFGHQKNFHTQIYICALVLS